MPEQERMDHRIEIDGKTGISLTGISKVETFEEDSVELQTPRGKLVLKGSGFHMGRFDVTTGELELEGCVIALAYVAGEKKGGLFGRLFR